MDSSQRLANSNSCVFSSSVGWPPSPGRVPAGGSTTFEFRADRAGTFRFYCNLTNESGHSQMHGELVVRAK